jgi:GTP-binding protein
MAVIEDAMTKKKATRVVDKRFRQRRSANISEGATSTGGNFIDLVHLRVQGGHGGSGAVHFAREPFKEVAPPDGGNGGSGGNIWVEVQSARTDLRSLQRRYTADEGGKGQPLRGKGKTGEDIVFKVPRGTVIEEIRPAIPPKEWVQPGGTAESSDWSIPHQSLFIDTSHPMMPAGTRFLLSTGGRGGRGNYHFASSTNRSPIEFTEGVDGQVRYLRVELKTIADIGLVGMPNAGKSSFLRSVSRCRTAVGDYAFTTLHPFLGTIQFPAQRVPLNDNYGRPSENHSSELVKTEPVNGVQFIRSTEDENSKILPPFSFNIADIPGIIRGAAEHNRGLGHAFLRHIERSRLLVYVLDISQPHAWDDFMTLIKELERHQPGMALQKRGLVIANKADIVSTDLLSDDDNNDPNGRLALTELNFQQFHSRLLADERFKGWEAIPVSAKYRKNVTKVLWRMREIVEESVKEEQELYADETKRQIEQYGEVVDHLWTRPEFMRGVAEYRLPDKKRK